VELSVSLGHITGYNKLPFAVEKVIDVVIDQLMYVPNLLARYHVLNVFILCPICGRSQAFVFSLSLLGVEFMFSELAFLYPFLNGVTYH
jgi:hypothetical protein